MNKYFSAMMVAVALCGMTACEPQVDPLEKEQYIKEVYLVGAAQDMFEREISYNGDGSVFVSAAIGGTKFPEHDVTVTLALSSDEAIKNYNYKNISDGETQYEMMPSSMYSFESMSGVIKAGEVYCRIPLKIDVNQVDPDKKYMIPLEVASTSEYSVGTEHPVLLFAPKMVNDYSGSYMFDGVTRKLNADGTEDINSASSTTNLRTATAMNANTIRLFQKVALEKPANVDKETYTIQINSDNTLTIKGFKDMPITDGGGSYDKSTGNFSFWYIYTDGNNQYKVTATLTKQK